MKFFLTATDTNAGKTHTGVLLLQGLSSLTEGPVCAFKPLCSGSTEDLELLAGAHAPPAEPASLCMRYFSLPATPSVAAAAEATEVLPGDLLAWCRERLASYDHGFIEGVGGWRAPIWRDWTVAEWAAELGLPVVLVVPNRLGCINHTLLTARDMRSMGVRLAGIILNTQDPSVLPQIASSNSSVLANDFGLNILADIPFGAKALPPDTLRRIADAVLSQAS